MKILNTEEKRVWEKEVKHMKRSLTEQERISVAFFSNQNLLSLFTLSFSSYLLQHESRAHPVLRYPRDVLEIGCSKFLTTVLCSKSL